MPEDINDISSDGKIPDEIARLRDQADVELGPDLHPAKGVDSIMDEQEQARLHDLATQAPMSVREADATAVPSTVWKAGAAQPEVFEKPGNVMPPQRMTEPPSPSSSGVHVSPKQADVIPFPQAGSRYGPYRKNK